MARSVSFGLSLDYLGGDLSPDENLEILLTLARTAREADFDLLYMGQHFGDAQYMRFQPLPMLGRLAAEAHGMILIYADIVSLDHPIRVAHDLATLDVIAGGRAGLLSVLGYAPAEFSAFGINRSERAGRLNEAYEIIARLCMGERVSLEGNHFRVSDVTLGLLRPQAQPRPPIWVTAHSDRALPRAAQFGDAWFISHQPTHGELEEQIPQYLDLLARRSETSYHAHENHGVSLPLLRETFVAESERRALDIAEVPMMRGVNSYVSMGQLDALRDPATYNAPFAQWRQNRALIGDPAQVTRDLERYVELGVDCPVFKVYHQGISLDDAVRSIQLIGREVIPAFR